MTRAAISLAPALILALILGPMIPEAARKAARDPELWATILDMPGQHFDAVECVLDNFRDEAPTRDTLRAWFTDSIRIHDMTDRLIEVWHARNERLEAAE